MELTRLNTQYLVVRDILKAGVGCHLRLIEIFSRVEKTTENAPGEWRVEDMEIQGYEGPEQSYRLIYMSKGQQCFILPFRADSVEFRYEGAGFAGHMVMIITMETL